MRERHEGGGGESCERRRRFLYVDRLGRGRLLTAWAHAAGGVDLLWRNPGREQFKRSRQGTKLGAQKVACCWNTKAEEH